MTTEKMEYKERDVFGYEKKTYVASQSLDKKMDKVILWSQILSAAVLFAVLVGVFVLFWIARNNFFSQLLSVLKVCRQAGLVY